MRFSKILGVFILSNVILLIFLTLFPLRAIDISQGTGMPPFKEGIPTGSARTISFKHILSQTFKPKASTISGVAFYASQPQKSTKRVFYLSVKQDGKTLKKITFRTKDIKHGLNTFFFKPIQVSRKVHRLEISVGRKNRYYLLAWKANNDVYNEGSLFVNDREYKEDLVFQTYYNDSLIKILTNVNKANPPLISLLFAIPLFELLLFLSSLAISKLTNSFTS